LTDLVNNAPEPPQIMSISTHLGAVVWKRTTLGVTISVRMCGSGVIPRGPQISATDSPSRVSQSDAEPHAAGRDPLNN
jgi:hypothetical protein